MRTILTFSGNVDAVNLGLALVDEHVLVLTPELQEAFAGLTAPGLGRNARRVARAVGQRP